MSFDGIHVARTGMAASQRALDVIGDNIANVGTPGHSRRRVDQASMERTGPSLHLGPGAHGTGVRITGVDRIRDVVIDRSVRAELSNSAGAELTADTLARVEQLLGPIDGGLTDALGAFWNSWEEISLDPGSMAARTQALASAERLAGQIRGAAQGLTGVVADNEQQAATMLVDQNAALGQVAALNGRIRVLEAQGETPNALLDQRDLLLDSLAGGLGANVHLLENGMASVSVNGFELVRGEVAEALTLAGTPPRLQTSAGHVVVPGGSIGSLLVETRSLADQIGADLDTVAIELRDLVNTTHSSGFDLAGNAGGDVFSATGAADLAVVATLSASGLAASATGEANDGNHALALADLRSEAGANGTVADQLLAVTGRVGAARASTAARAELNATMLDEVRAARSAVSGVNIDEELTLLLQYQRSYEASARVLTAVDEMLDVLVNRTGLVGR